VCDTDSLELFDGLDVVKIPPRILDKDFVRGGGSRFEDKNYIF
jgi:hypothetical protein